MIEALRWLTTERLATLLSEELERDGWGDVDPHWIQMVGDGAYDADDDHAEQAEALGKVLDRVVARLKHDFGPEPEPITADTITDEQIRELLTSAKNTTDIAWCQVALAGPAVTAGQRRQARARCAQILTARRGTR